MFYSPIFQEASHILTPLLLSTFSPACAVNPTHCPTLPVAFPTTSASPNLLSRNSLVSAKSGLLSLVMNRSVAAYIVDSEALLVYQLESTDLSPARNQISSAREESSEMAVGRLLGWAMSANAWNSCQSICSSQRRHCRLEAKDIPPATYV